MAAPVVHDPRWLIAALLLFFTFGGTWRTVVRIKDAIAFGRLDPSFNKLRRRLQVYRWMGLLFVGGSLFQYWYSYPFPNLMWLFVGLWTLLGIARIGEGLRALDTLKKG